MSDQTAIQVTVEAPFKVDGDAIHRAVAQALALGQAILPAGLAVTITSADRVRALNQQYAGIDSTTDVLSFPVDGEPYDVEPGEPPYLGDVVIAYTVAESQARDAGLPLIAELQLLAIHGTLHLLGFDHDTPNRQAEMWALQSAAMDAARADRKA